MRDGDGISSRRPSCDACFPMPERLLSAQERSPKPITFGGISGGTRRRVQQELMYVQ
jgi:hypothetical protein